MPFRNIQNSNPFCVKVGRIYSSQNVQKNFQLISRSLLVLMISRPCDFKGPYIKYEGLKWFLSIVQYYHNQIYIMMLVGKLF